MKTNVVFLFIILVFSLGCSKESPKSTGKLQGLHKYYFPDGGLYLEINYKDSLPHGLAKRYYKSGQLLEEAEYRNGIQHGFTKMYHENGKLSSITPYDSGRIHGVKKKYRKDGTPAYEAPYHYDQPCVGLTELFLSGRPVDNYPKIVITPKDDLLRSNMFTLEFSLSDKSRLVEFYKGELTDGKYIGTSAKEMYVSNGVGKLFYVLPPGGYAMETLSVLAKVKTDLNNYYITKTTYNLAIENR
jgi:MORN repeat variant